jgi:hypothetical protein
MNASEMKATILGGLQSEHQQCVLLIEWARRCLHVEIGRDLPYALSTAIDTYRALRSDALDWQAAFAKYCEVTAITTAVDTAIWQDGFEQERARVVSDFEARLERLERRGFAVADSDGVYSLTTAGRAALANGEIGRGE